MLSKWPIRNKLQVGIGLLVVIVATLSMSGFQGVYGYRSLVRNVSGRSTELTLATTLAQQVSDLRAAASDLRRVEHVAEAQASDEFKNRSAQFAKHLVAVRETVANYRSQLVGNDESETESTINDSHEEWRALSKIEHRIAEVDAICAAPAALKSDEQLARVATQLSALQTLSAELPSYLHQRLHDFAGEVRTQYRTLIVITWVTSICGTLLIGLLIRLFYQWIFGPLRVLVRGSRRVAAGEFGHRIVLESSDEMSELAGAMNDMTARFQAIRDDLDRQVQERTKQVVRSEQLASVGFLAAGVAHEINNPLASIAMCAESLEGRFRELLEPDAEPPQSQSEVVLQYLSMIQNEAFRCKGITERLLDFSRMGDVEHHHADLRELVQGVIDMVAHLGRYHDKRVEFAPGPSVVAPVNAQEMKQVILNLITNGLDAVSPGGTVRLSLASVNGQAELTIVDDGCGMTEEVRQHLFEPFFTRRRTGQGIGLGLSITYRIIADHNGQIEVHSDGPGRGSEFRVSLPLTEKQKETEHRYQAA